MQRFLSFGAVAGALMLLSAISSAQPPQPVRLVANPCPRPAAGGVVQNPPSLFGADGVLAVRFSYQHRFDSQGRELFCFMTPEGLQNPTLHVKPGDHLVITVTNNLPPGTGSMGVNAPNCGAPSMNSSSVNIHYHGTNTSPTCHQDEVIKTLINPNDTFQYNVAFPANEPPGLYWYHPHVHGIAEHALQGGAAGAIVVDGIENVQPAVSELPQRILLVRDQNTPGNLPPMGNVPSWDVTLNYIPITSPATPGGTIFTPAILQMQAGQKQFLRVSNSCSDTILDLQYIFDGKPQTMQLVEIDGVPVNSQDGTDPGPTIPVTHFLLPPASRVEFIVSAPTSGVQLAQLITLGINTGQLGDNDPQRPLATIHLVEDEHDASIRSDTRLPKFSRFTTQHQRFAGLAKAPIAQTRTVYFDENCAATSTNCTPNQFFMAVDAPGKTEHVFDPNLPPDIIATQGTVEQWTIQNRAGENHEFHFHQVHFLVQSQNNFKANRFPNDPDIIGQYLDMVQVPAWDGVDAFPSVTVLIDFRGPDIGDFVFHCHILNHEDQGMMNIIQVKAPDDANNVNGAGRTVAANAKPGAVQPSVAAEVSAHSLEIADRVVAPANAGTAGKSASGAHHH